MKRVLLGMLLGEEVLLLGENSVAAKDLRKCVVGKNFWNQEISSSDSKLRA